AELLGIAANKIVCRIKRVGGAFGGKESKSLMLSMALAVGAWHLRKPIRCMLSREEDIMITGQRHPFSAKWKAGLTKDGKITAMDSQYYANGGWSMDVSIIVVQACLQCSDCCYYIPNVQFMGRVCKTNIHSHTAFRGFGRPQGTAITESMLSEVADRMGIDVNELREKNFYVEGQLTPCNQTFKDWYLPLVYQQVKEISEFEKRRKEVDEFNSKNKWRKRGLSLIPIKFGVAFPVPFLNQAGALVHIYLDGSVLISHSGVELGQGLNTKMLQIASETLDVPMDTGKKFL
ncbi:10062_t:CDS:2, partial [Racocetra persica]